MSEANKEAPAPEAAEPQQQQQPKRAPTQGELFAHRSAYLAKLSPLDAVKQGVAYRVFNAEVALSKLYAEQKGVQPLPPMPNDHAADPSVTETAMRERLEAYSIVASVLDRRDAERKAYEAAPLTERAKFMKSVKRAGVAGGGGAPVALNNMQMAYLRYYYDMAELDALFKRVAQLEEVKGESGNAEGAADDVAAEEAPKEKEETIDEAAIGDEAENGPVPIEGAGVDAGVPNDDAHEGVAPAEVASAQEEQPASSATECEPAQSAAVDGATDIDVVIKEESEPRRSTRRRNKPKKLQ